MVSAVSKSSVRAVKPVISFMTTLEGMGIEVEYVTDLQKIMEYGAMSMPALVINEKVVSVGRVLKPSEISAMISDITDKSECI